MAHRLQVIDQSPRVWADIPLSDEAAECFKDSPVGVLGILEKVVCQALSQTGVQVERPLYVSLQEANTHEE